MTLTLINPTPQCYRDTEHPWVLWFGACGSTHLLVYARHLQDALDECIDWIAENAPGLLSNEQVTEAYNKAITSGMTQEQAWGGVVN